MNEGLLETHTGTPTALTREQISQIGAQNQSEAWKEVMDFYDLETSE